MPGLIPHLIAGTALYFIGVSYYRSYFKENNKLLLAIVCLTFSVIPDLFLGLYYTTNLLSYETLLPYHVFTHMILTPIAIIIFTLLLLIFDTKRKPIWVMGIWALLLHIVMDILIEEMNLFL